MVGTAVILDLRLLGWRLLRQPVSQVAKDLAPVDLDRHHRAADHRPVSFLGRSVEYVQVTAFRVKMALLLGRADLSFHGDPSGHGSRARRAAAGMAQARGGRLLGAVG